MLANQNQKQKEETQKESTKTKEKSGIEELSGLAGLLQHMVQNEIRKAKESEKQIVQPIPQIAKSENKIESVAPQNEESANEPLQNTNDQILKETKGQSIEHMKSKTNKFTKKTKPNTTSTKKGTQRGFKTQNNLTTQTTIKELKSGDRLSNQTKKKKNRIGLTRTKEPHKIKNLKPKKKKTRGNKATSNQTESDKNQIQTETKQKLKRGGTLLELGKPLSELSAFKSEKAFKFRNEVSEISMVDSGDSSGLAIGRSSLVVGPRTNFDFSDPKNSRMTRHGQQIKPRFSKQSDKNILYGQRQQSGDGIVSNVGNSPNYDHFGRTEGLTRGRSLENGVSQFIIETDEMYQDGLNHKIKDNNNINISLGELPDQSQLPVNQETQNQHNANSDNKNNLGISNNLKMQANISKKIQNIEISNTHSEYINVGKEPGQDGIQSAEDKIQSLELLTRIMDEVGLTQEDSQDGFDSLENFTDFIKMTESELQNRSITESMLLELN